MALHTDQQHPHVHMVVKAESEQGQRLHIDKTMLRSWREDFARLMREQGIAANATPSVARGRSKTKTPSAIYRSRERGASHLLRERITEIAQQLSPIGFYEDPARPKLLETRAAVTSAWRNV